LTHRRRSLSRAIALILTATSLTSEAFAQFETRGNSPVPQPQSSIAVADFNSDGKLDVAAITITGKVAVLLGRGDGTFQSAVYYDIDSEVESVRSVASADLDGNGDIDLAVADYLGGNIYVLLGNGDGTFKQPAKMPMNGPYPQFVAIGDFNGDHVLDLITVDATGACPCISVLLGNGKGTFQAPINTKPNIGPTAIGIGDFNGDGKLDVASVGADINSEVTILLGNGNGTFQTGTSYKVAANPQSVAVADFNGDGKLDLAICSPGGIDIFMGNGDGTFQSPVLYSVAFPGSIQVADFNGDGKADLAVVDGQCKYGSCTVGVLLGNGDGTFRPVVNYPAGKGVAFVAVGDFNGDHMPDLAVAESLASAVGVLLNTGVVSFSPTTPVTFPSQLVNTTSTAQTLTLTNTGKTALTISAMKSSGQFSATSTCGSSVAPGAKCDLNVTFSPQTQGSKSGTLSLKDSASTKPQVIELSGAGTVVELSPPSLTFGSQKVGSKSTPQSVQLTNTGTAAIGISQIINNGTDGGDFLETNNCPSSLNAAASCTITVTFDPRESGTRTATLSISDTGGGSPQTVPLTGTGD
jgi:FG-GAP-like repeat/Abnormal spindle-like microcephaly-assoc'd, ASPM-SPD-2-Hydin